MVASGFDSADVEGWVVDVGSRAGVLGGVEVGVALGGGGAEVEASRRH